MDDCCARNLDLAMRYLGWGDPLGGLWFVGIEEGAGAEWSPGQDVVGEFSRAATYASCGEAMYERGANAATIKPDRFAGWSTHVPLWSAKIASRVSRLGMQNPWMYRDQRLWVDGSQTFNANLWPLSKPKDNETWPSHYDSLFGVGLLPTAKRYYAPVRQRRFPLLRAFREEMKPQAIICFGKGNWWNFSQAFGTKSVSDLREGRADAPGRVGVDDDARVIFTHFFGQGIHDADVEPIVAILKGWGVSIP